MDVGDLSNAAGLAGRAAAVLGPPGGEFVVTNTNNTVDIINSTNTHVNPVWWSSTSTVVTAPTNSDVMNQLCRVCGEPAAGFHFGAFTCEGCKSFFGRTYNNLGSISECKNGGVCVINKKNRTACKACRLRKCLMVGMSKSGSRYGRRSNWFKIHCLLQEQSHQAQQARLKDVSKSYDKALNLDAANNNNSFPPNLPTNSAIPDKADEISPRLSIPRPDLAHDLMRPAVRFPLWRQAPFFHPVNMQLLSPFFPFQQRFMVPYNQVQLPVTSLSSSSESVSPRSTPSPKNDVRDSPVDDKSIAFLKSLGPEQEEPMDLSRKSAKSDQPDQQDTEENAHESDDVIESETGPPLDLSWKT